MESNYRNYKDMYTQLEKYTNGFTIPQGSWPCKNHSELVNCEDILNEYYNITEKRGLDFDNLNLDGTDYTIQFSDPKNPIWDNGGLNYMTDKNPSAGPLGEDYNSPVINMFVEDIEKHDELNQAIFNGEKMDGDVRVTLLKCADNYITKLSDDGVGLKPIDIVLLGSNASYNYTKDSDIDVHIICDTSIYDSEELILKLYNAYKTLWNNKYDPKIYGHKVELYVEPNEVLANSNGIYSILNDEWIKKPDHSAIPEINYEKINDDLKPFIERFNDADTIKKIDNLIDDIYLQRISGILKDGEYSSGNLVFKEFRNRGYLSELKQRKVKLENRDMSLEKLEEELSIEDISMDARGKHYCCKIVEPDGTNNYYENRSDAEHDLELLKKYYNESLSDGTVLGSRFKFMFPNVQDTLKIYLQWEGIYGYDDDIMEYQNKSEDDLIEYLEDQDIYGYTSDIWDILQGFPAECRGMDEDDFIDICEENFISPEENLISED